MADSSVHHSQWRSFYTQETRRLMSARPPAEPVAPYAMECRAAGGGREPEPAGRLFPPGDASGQRMGLEEWYEDLHHVLGL